MHNNNLSYLSANTRKDSGKCQMLEEMHFIHRVNQKSATIGKALPTYPNSWPTDKTEWQLLRSQPFTQWGQMT